MRDLFCIFQLLYVSTCLELTLVCEYLHVCIYAWTEQLIDRSTKRCLYPDSPNQIKKILAFCISHLIHHHTSEPTKCPFYSLELWKYWIPLHVNKLDKMCTNQVKENHWLIGCWERLRAGGVGGDRGWDNWMASLT